MPRLYILSHLTTAKAHGLDAGVPYYSSRKLSAKEIHIARSYKIRRYDLTSLDDLHRKSFFANLDLFWDDVLKYHGKNPYFWRNCVSSKMQEWEESVGYLALVLFALSVARFEKDSELIVLPDSVEEAEVWRNWALTRKWTVISYGFGWTKHLRQGAENILRFGLIFIRSIYKKLSAPPVKRSVRDGAFLLATMYYQQALREKKYEDLFFGRIHDEIARYGRDVFYLGDAIDAFRREDAAFFGKEGRPVSIYSMLSWRDIFAGIWVVLTRAPRFSNVFFCDVDMSRLLSWHARRFRYDFTLTAEYFHRAVRRACRRYDFTKMLYAYEGNVYERAAIQAFREESFASIDAYSHAVLYPLNLKLRASPSEEELAPEPDRYLVCSKHACDILHQIRGVKTAMISACSLRSIPQSGDIKKSDGANVLVVLDGVWSTIVVLDWLYQNADVFKGRPVVVRPHPNVSWDSLIRQCPNYQEGVFSLSHRSLKDELEGAFCVLYRQSSVGIQALMHGIPAIHLKVDQPLSGDPIKDIELGRMVVTDALGLSKALSRVAAVRRETLFAGRDARSFAAGYFTPPRPELLQFFAEVRP